MVAADLASPGGGLLLAFEGIDGSGKSTQVQRCAEWLAGLRPARAVTVLREPGGTPLGEAVRGILLAGGSIGALAEMLLYMAARAELYQQRVLPALTAGGIVLLDRSQYSTAAYQGAGLGLDQKAILLLARSVTHGRLPDRVVLFDIRPELARERLAGRSATGLVGAGGAGGGEGGGAHGGKGGDRIEQRDAEYFQRVAASYRAMAAEEPGRFVVIDASAEPLAVAGAVRAALGGLVGGRPEASGDGC